MDKQLKKIYLYIGIFVAIIFIGATYAFFTAGMSSETSTTVRADAGTMKITYDGGKDINLAGIYPKDDVWATKTITVTGNNTTDAEMYYKLTLVVDSNTFKTDDPLQYELVSTNDSTNGEIIPAISKKDITGTSIELGSGKFAKANNASHTYLLKIYYPKKTTSQNANQGAAFSAHVEITSAKAPKTNGKLSELVLYNNEVKTPITTPGAAISKKDITGTSIELGSGKFAKANNASHTYLLKIYYPRKATSQNANQGAAFSAHVEITSAKAPKTNGKLSELVLYNNEVKTPLTTPGAAISTESEALLASTEDDYGTSYYFRGSVKNNYVEFANKCWRIVRVGGDGSVKLILHNDNTAGAVNPCDAANNSASAAFARYSGETYKSAFNTDYNDNAYVGFKYGTVGASDYASTHANTNKSTILTNLDSWYDKNNLKDYEKVIADSVWCNDKTNVTDTTFDPWSWTPNGLGYAKNVTYYGATQRLASTSGSAGDTGPSLKCNGELSKITSKVGLITADELAFVGYAYDQNNNTTYLQENATDTYWWSLSPFGFNLGYANVLYVFGGYGSFGSYSVGSAFGVRPSISLKPSTNVTGNGSSDKPYVVG